MCIYVKITIYLHYDGVLSSVVEPKAAITVANKLWLFGMILVTQCKQEVVVKS